MSKASKGSAFERSICKELSLWWSGGESDDLFWRTSNSGGRATIRSRKGKTTSGHCGDVGATDDRGKGLLKVFTMELKRGYSKHTIQDLIDKSPGAAKQTWEAWIDQAKESAKQAGSSSWLIIARRDRREPLVMLERRFCVLDTWSVPLPGMNVLAVATLKEFLCEAQLNHIRCLAV